jgi:hypothetical protein
MLRMIFRPRTDTGSAAPPGCVLKAWFYPVLGDLLAGVRSLRQVLDQLGDTHLRFRAVAHDDDGNHLVGAYEALAAADELHQARTLLDQVESRLDRAMQHSGRIAWHEAPSDPALSILTRSGKISRIRKSSHSTCESLTRSGNPRARLLSTGMATSSRWIPSTLGAWRSRTSIRFASSSRSRGNGTSKCGPASCRRHPSRDTGLTVSN